MISEIDQFKRELQLWANAGVRPRLLLRDDDCIDVTRELETMVRFVEQREIPLLLAVIPKFATKALGEFVADHELITPAVHGYSHTNHALENEKKCEYCDGRDQAQMLDEMKRSRDILGNLFGNRLSPVFVPPWNRIGENAAMASAQAGFTAISGFGWKPQLDKVRRINTHVDVIDWKAGKAGKSYMTLVDEVRINLGIARENEFETVGILTHHLVRGDWRMLGEVFDLVDDIQWV